MICTLLAVSTFKHSLGANLNTAGWFLVSSREYCNLNFQPGTFLLSWVLRVSPAAATSAASGLWGWTPDINHALREGWFNIGQFVCFKWMEWIAHLCFWACPRPHRWVDRGAHWEAPACDCDSAEPHHCPDVLDSITWEQWQQHHRVCALPHLPEAKGKSKAWKTLLHWGKERSWSIFQSSKKIPVLESLCPRALSGCRGQWQLLLHAKGRDMLSQGAEWRGEPSSQEWEWAVHLRVVNMVFLLHLMCLHLGMCCSASVIGAHVHCYYQSSINYFLAISHLNTEPDCEFSGSFEVIISHLFFFIHRKMCHHWETNSNSPPVIFMCQSFSLWMCL